MNKKLIILLAAGLLTLAGCKSAGEHRLERVNACSAMCKEHPDIKEMTFDGGGAFLLFLAGGYEKETCTCHRRGG